MKIPTNTARRYAYSNFGRSESYDADKIVTAAQSGFEAGYEYGYHRGVARAEQWINVEYELPKEGKVVLTKVDCEKDDNINYQVATYIKQANLWITAVHSAIGIPQCFDTVDDYHPTHWRPIEHGKE